MSYTTAIPTGNPAAAAASTAQLPSPPAETAALPQCTTCHQCGSLVPLRPTDHLLHRSMSTSFERIADDLRPDTTFDDLPGMGSSLPESMTSSVGGPGSFSSMLSSPNMVGLNISFNEASKNAENDQASSSSSGGGGGIRRPMSPQSLRQKGASPRVRIPHGFQTRFHL